MVGLRAKRPHFTEKWLRFTLHFVAHFYSARNIVVAIDTVHGGTVSGVADFGVFTQVANQGYAVQGCHGDISH